jgi:uracil-DNA glycosylase
MWFEQMHPNWQIALSGQRDWLNETELRLATEREFAPNSQLVMAAFQLDPAQVRVLILGQDPYPTPGVAVGRAFAVAPGTRPLPASLRNIFLELQADLGGSQPSSDLAGWQRQGVLLLNRHLTTVSGTSGGHFDLGWQQFTDAAIEHLMTRQTPLILVLWGAQAAGVKKSLAEFLSKPSANFAIIESPHPSPLSAYRGFFGSKPFSAVNRQLQLGGLQPIDWNH